MFCGIFDHKHIVTCDGVGTEGDVTRCFFRVQTLAGFKPLALFIHKRHENNGRAYSGLCQSCNAVESFFGTRVQNVERFQFFQTRLFM